MHILPIYSYGGSQQMNRVRKAVFSEAVHKQGILGKGIGVAIVDTGLFPHPDYRSRITGW